ncbi:uncharacterized protein LOC107695961 [Sinocyclocheilus anshuiensis]|uniref:uncharacterized protein LOC107695961 n=1 Tax=Sinocyclocheilus anshuiensis TaxID=1608454 RepID=UPI0007B9CCE9|nr:PREDICTED: uncharacterized protein LOC107695961 [Sinocyclocheilus anshuiensis]
MAHLLVKILMSHFQEHEDGLVLHADVAASASDVEKTLNLPASPRLILLVATVFAVYYIFNLQYQEEVKHVLSQAENIEMAHLLVKSLTLMSHFQEHEDGLVLHADVTASDVEKTHNLPASPRLILLVATVFAVYYIFNLQYQEEACCTLEFLQRRFIGINPERGSKTCRGKVVSKKTGKVANKKSATVNPKVASRCKLLIS